jgi:lysophospholipase L1-like esterase
VLNAGIGGGRVLQDGLGPNAAARFDRDVLAQSHARYVIVFEGINDIGTLTRDAPVDAATHAAFVMRMETAYAQMIQQAHDHGLKIYGATITPFFGSDYYHPDAANEADRQALNAWIRDPSHYDGVIDFDAVMRDPQRPEHLRAEYDGGDHLHPNAAGYKAMGESVPVSLFTAEK